MANRSSGFTVTELLIAIALIGILAAVALPSFSSYGAPFRVSAAGREVYAAMQEVRQQSIARGTRTRFQVNGTDSYTLQWDDEGAWRTIRGPIKLARNVRLVSSGGSVVFQPRGTAAPLTTVTVSDVTHPEYRMRVSVPITGLVRIVEGGG